VSYDEDMSDEEMLAAADFDDELIRAGEQARPDLRRRFEELVELAAPGGLLNPATQPIWDKIYKVRTRLRTAGAETLTGLSDPPGHAG
jgi:hypothetical protein